MFETISRYRKSLLLQLKSPLTSIGQYSNEFKSLLLQLKSPPTSIGHPYSDSNLFESHRKVPETLLKMNGNFFSLKLVKFTSPFTSILSSSNMV